METSASFEARSAPSPYPTADNHDVTRIASRLRDPAHVYPLHVILFTMPGVPSVYYGSEWGIPRMRGPQGVAARAGVARRRLVDRLDPASPVHVTGERVQLEVPPCWGRVLAVE